MALGAVASVLLKACAKGIFAGLVAKGVEVMPWERLYDEIEKRIDPYEKWKNPFQKNARAESETATEESEIPSTKVDENENIELNPSQQQQPNQEDEDKNNAQSGNTGGMQFPSFTDGTNNNIEQQIQNFDLQGFLKEYEQRQANLTKLAMEREDTAVERWVASAQRAGVNPNLLGSIGQADSNAVEIMSGMNENELIELLSGSIGLLEQEIGQDFQLDLNKFKVGANAITTILAGIIMLASKGGIKLK